MHAEKRVFVTGGAGFIGSHLCERLFDGHDVLCVDNFFTGSRRNIDASARPSALRADAPRRDFPLYVEVDEIYNLACPASPMHYQFDPVQTTKTSVHRRHQHAGPGQAAASAKILQASTSEVYGDPDVHPQTRGILGQRQSDRPALLLRRGQALRRDAVLRLSPPAQAAASRWRGSSTPTVRACIPNDGRVVSNFIVQALEGRGHHALWRRQRRPARSAMSTI